VFSSIQPIWSRSWRPPPKYARSRSSSRGKMRRLTDTLGSRLGPAAARASRKIDIRGAGWMWRVAPGSAPFGAGLRRVAPGRPAGGVVRPGPAPDPVPEAFRVQLEAEQPGRVGEHRPRVRLGEALALQQLEEHLGALPGHVGVGLSLRRVVPEVAEAVDDL